MASFGQQDNSEQVNSPSKGQRVFSWLRRNFWGLATITVVAIACLIIVKVFKKPGQMTVIESQAMDMGAMVPPVGAVPVAIAPVARKVVEGSVTYTGTVQAFEDEDVYPRVTGRIVRMPVYPGDRVGKDDLLVQLDPSVSEYQARLQEAKDEADAQTHNTSIAKEEFREKEFEYKAALEEEHAAAKSVDEAKATLQYWLPETQRQKALYEKEVVSLDEYQLEESKRDASRAKTEEAEARLRAATNKRIAAEAAYNAMTHHVAHQHLLASKARAAQLNAAIYDQYTRIRAKDDAVVIKRVISPGVVVNPGMLILKVAHVKQVRVQAEVSATDADKIKLGDAVSIKSASTSAEVVPGKITSVFPAADPTIRTFIVEALVDNVRQEQGAKRALHPVKAVTDYYFLPGQYVVMRIVIGRSEGLAIPTSAVLWNEGKPMVWKAGGGSDSANKKYSCLMHPEVVSDKPGQCPKCGMQLQQMERSGRKVAQLVEIKIGLSNPDFTEVTHGVNEGEEVITAGYENLTPGAPVVATEWGAAGAVKLPTPAEVTSTRLDASNKWTLEQMQGDLMLNVSLAPTPPKSGDNWVVVRVTKHGGGALSGVRLSAKTSMPGMNMAGPEINGTTDSSGLARMKADFSSGPWQAALVISAPSEKRLETTVDIEVP